METNVSKVICSLCVVNKIEGGENTHFLINNKMSDRKKNEFTPNVLTIKQLADLEYIGQFRRNLSENENSSDMNNSESLGSSTTASITNDEPSINRATLMDEGQLGVEFSVLRLFLISVIKFLQKLK